MSLTTGSRLGVYEIAAPLGAGGMGEVYRAHDTKLGRQVAIKVLPDSVDQDAERVARFEREAKALAALNHPYIATLYGMEREDHRHFLVMELVHGETLAERIGRGPLPVTDALAIARQIAEALEAAHEHGIVHRDLKPANVKVTPDGVVKVLDFGLAKSLDPAPGSTPNASYSPTLSVMATGAGIILGTAPYMSPEQAKGVPADHRTDVFAFGCVLYEMLTGDQAFAGDTVSDVLASVIAREPNWQAVPATLDPRLANLLRRCLAKSRRDRWQSIGDVRIEVEQIIAQPQAAAAPSPSPSLATRSRWRYAAGLAGTALVAAAGAGWTAWNWKPAAAGLPVVRFTESLGVETALFTNFNRQVLAVSPDGTQIVHAGEQLYLRHVSDATPRPIPGTQGFISTTHPAFSPDGRSVVFWVQSDRSLKRLTFGNASVSTLCPLGEGGYGLSWSGDYIYFSDTGKGIQRVPANGGQPEPVIPAQGREEMYGPQLLPDGETLLYTLGTRVMPSWDAAQVVAQSLRTGKRTTLLERGTDARYLSSGHLLFGRGGVLYAVPFDLKQLAVVGEPIAIVEGVRRAAPGTTGAFHFAVSANGTLVYVPGPVSSSAAAVQIAFFDRSGGVDPLNVPLGPYNHPRASPDGTNAAVGSDDGKESQIWIYGLSRSSAARRLTFGGSNAFPEWSADGTRVAFQSTREGDAGLWWQRADGTDKAVRLTRPDSGAAHVPQSWSPDGRLLLYDELRGDRVTLWVFSVADRKAVRFSSFDSDVPTGATFSPDGRWVAYTTRLTGQAMQAVVYVEPYPVTGARYQISKDSEDGHHPSWSPDGHELLYTPGPGNRFVSVPVTTTPTFSFGDPVIITRPFLNAPPTMERTYDMSRDGKRILGLRTDVGSDGRPLAPQVRVVLNWFEELKARVPLK